MADDYVVTVKVKTQGNKPPKVTVEIKKKKTKGPVPVSVKGKVL